MVSHHPSMRCRRGSADILVNFDDLYPSNKWLENKHEHENGTGHATLDKFEICGKEVPRGYWMFCRGSKNDTRGFSCGLWVLLHSLSVRVEDGESQLAFTTTCDFIHQFFICEECSQHFYNMCSRVSTPFSSARDFVLWLWTAHNEVNQRLKKTEASLGTGDPKFPKSIWPSKQLCPTCYTDHNQNEESSSIDWDRDEVVKFLGIYYGKTLVSLYKEKDKAHNQIKNSAASEEVLQSTNALVVPVGAALAIAVASCLFGALACFWRSQQKNRKPKRSWSWWLLGKQVTYQESVYIKVPFSLLIWHTLNTCIIWWYDIVECTDWFLESYRFWRKFTSLFGHFFSYLFAVL